MFYWVSYCNPFAKIAVFFIISLLLAALGWQCPARRALGHDSRHLCIPLQTFGIWGLINPQLQRVKPQSTGVSIPGASAYAEGDVPWRKPCTALLTKAYNFCHIKIFAEMLGVHNASPVDWTVGKLAGLTHPNGQFTSERSKTESCGWKRKRKLLHILGKDKLSSVIPLPSWTWRHLSLFFSFFFLMVIFFKNNLLIIHGLQ